MKKHSVIITDVRYRMSLAAIRDIGEPGAFGKFGTFDAFGEFGAENSPGDFCAEGEPGRLGAEVIAVECDGSSAPLGFYSRYADRCEFLNKEKYADELYALCERVCAEKGEKPALLPIGVRTLNLLAEQGERFSKVCGFLIPSKDQLDLLNDKKRLAAFAAQAGVKVPKVYAYPYNDAEYPCVVKPLCGEKLGLKAKDRYRIVCCEEELLAALLHFAKVLGRAAAADRNIRAAAEAAGEKVVDAAGEKAAEAASEKAAEAAGEKVVDAAPVADLLVVQQYIEGDGFGCSVLARDGKVLSSISHRRIREYPVSGGPSSCCCSVFDEKLENSARILAEKIGLSGLAMFEYKQGRDGEYYLLECNPRVWGSFPLTRVCGSDISRRWYLESLANAGIADARLSDALLADAALRRSFAAQSSFRENAERMNAPDFSVRKGCMHFAFSDICAGLGYIKKGQVGRGFGAFASCFNPRVRGGLFEAKDPMPALKYLIGSILR